MRRLGRLLPGQTNWRVALVILTATLAIFVQTGAPALILADHDAGNSLGAPFEFLALPSFPPQIPPLGRERLVLTGLRHDTWLDQLAICGSLLPRPPPMA